MRPLRPALPREPEVRFETLPGVEAQADWKHLGVCPLGEEQVELHAMVVILGHSRMPPMRIASSCTREVSFERLVRCLDDLGGVTRELLTDRDTVFCNHGAQRTLSVPEHRRLLTHADSLKAALAFRAATFAFRTAGRPDLVERDRLPRI